MAVRFWLPRLTKAGNVRGRQTAFLFFLYVGLVK